MKYLLIALIILTGCEKDHPESGEKPVWDKQYEIIKISIEPCSEDCSYKNNRDRGWENNESYKGEPAYNIFTIGSSRSFWNLAAGRVALKLTDKGMPYLRETRSTKWNKRENRYEFSDKRNYELYLEPCYRYKQSKSFVVRESGSNSSSFLGLVYVSSSYSRSYEWREDELVMPCLKVKKDSAND